MASKKRACCVAAALVATVLCGTPALAQQTLTLSYKLDVKRDAVQPAPALFTRCAGFNWVASVGACGRDLLARIAPVAERLAKAVPLPGDTDTASTAPAPAAETTLAGTDAAPPARLEAPELPLGLTPPDTTRTLRPVTASSRAPDLLLRLGSRHRIKSNEEGALEGGRFLDTTYQSHLYNNGHKALGVELLVPFQ